MNKVQRAAKEAIEMVADELGGVDRMVAWVKEDPKNESLFWGTIYPKLLPLNAQLSASGGLLEILASLSARQNP